MTYGNPLPRRRTVAALSVLALSIPAGVALASGGGGGSGSSDSAAPLAEPSLIQNNEPRRDHDCPWKHRRENQSTSAQPPV